MKKISILLVVFISFLIQVTVSANTSIVVAIDGQQVCFDVQPTEINGRTMVPLRAIFESLGATVLWDEATKTVTSVKGNIQISLAVDNNILTVNGKQIVLDVPATTVRGRTLVPVRAISEAFGYQVDWYNNTAVIDDKVITDKIVSIITNEQNIYQAFVDFVKTNGSYENNVYTVSTEYEKYNAEKAWTSYEEMKYCFDAAKNSLFVEYTDALFYDNGTYIVEDLLIPIPKKDFYYDWIYTEKSSTPRFLQGYGKVKATYEKHKDSEITTQGLLEGREIRNNEVQSSAELMFSMFDLRSENIFIEHNSLLRLQYFGI